MHPEVARARDKYMLSRSEDTARSLVFQAKRYRAELEMSEEVRRSLATFDTGPNASMLIVMADTIVRATAGK